MPQKRLKQSFLCVCLLLCFCSSNLTAQNTGNQTSLLSDYLTILEDTYDIKFSFVDSDLQQITIFIPEKKTLELLLDDIQQQTQIKIEKVSNRYYALTKSTTIDICGRVLDNFEQNTIPGTTVTILERSLAIITDAEGVFSFENIPRDAVLQIRHIGFKPLFIPAKNLLTSNPCKTLLLKEKFEQLEEVVVQQFLTTGLAKEVDGSIQMSSDEFGLLPGLSDPDVLQSIQALPGIKSIDETVSNINIRGGTNDQNLILWDGIKMYQSGHFFGLISAFNPYLTEKVSLIKNGTSAAYGDGVSGVLDIETKNKISDQFFGGAGFNLINGDLYGQIPIAHNAAIQFSGRRSLTDFFNTPTYNQFFERAFQDSEIKGSTGLSEDIQRSEDFYFYDFTGKLLYDLNDIHTIRLSIININNSLQYNEINNTESRESDSRLYQTNLAFGGSIQSKWNSYFSTKLNAYYTRYDLDSNNTIVGSPQILSQENEVIETGLKLSSVYTFSDALSWQNGYELRETGIYNFSDVTLPPFQNKIKGVLRIHSLFSEAEYTSSNQKLFARVGGRLNYVENLNTFSEYIFEPRLTINYEWANNLKIEAQGEFKNQTTHQVVDLEQNFLGIEKRRWYIADPNNPLLPLPITKSKQASLGVNYDHHSLYIGIEGFYKKVNGISARTQGFQSKGQFNEEIGGYETKGLEFLINKKTSYYSAWLSYTYNLNNYTFNDNIPKTFPNNLDIRHTATLAANYYFRDLIFGIGLNYRSGKPYTQPDEINPVDTNFFPSQLVFKTPNSSRLPEYFRFDTSIKYNFDISSSLKATVSASVLNFTNRINILNTYYRLNDADEVETIESKSLGLTPNFSFRLSF